MVGGLIDESAVAVLHIAVGATNTQLDNLEVALRLFIVDLPQLFEQGESLRLDGHDGRQHIPQEELGVRRSR